MWHPSNVSHSSHTTSLIWESRSLIWESSSLIWESGRTRRRRTPDEMAQVVPRDAITVIMRSSE